MKNIKNDKSRNERDETIGRALSEAIANNGPIGPCLTDEDIAALIDGILEAEERDLLMKHLSSCESCLMMFRTSQVLMDKRPVHTQKNRFILPSVGIAIAALLAIFINISLQNSTTDRQVANTGKKDAPTEVHKQAAVPSPVITSPLPGVGAAIAYLPASAFETARQLASGKDNKFLVAAIVSNRSQVYGFSGAVLLEKRAFRLGVHATDLELFLQANDLEGAVTQLKQVIDLLQVTNKDQIEVVRLKEIARKIESGISLQGFSGCTASIEKIHTARVEQFLYRFGIWAEGGRLAAIASNREYVTANSLRYVKDGVRGMQLPPGIANALGEIETVIGRGEFTEKDFFVMKQAFEDIVALF